MKRVLLATVALLLWGSPPLMADTILTDPLHGTVCSGSGTGCNATEVGGVVPGAFGFGNGGTFGFNSSPAGASGDLTVAVLIPDNVAFTLPTISGTGFSGATTLTAAGGGVDWLNTSKVDLAQFIFGTSANSSPANPQSAFSGPSGTQDPGLTGFFVFTADAGQIGPVNGQSATTTPDFFALSGGLPAGSTVVGFMTQTGGSIISTAPSGQIQAQAVPGPIVGAGLPGLFSALIGLWGLNRRRKRFVA